MTESVRSAGPVTSGQELAPELALKLNTVVFDLGGVLIGWDPARLFEPLLDPSVDVERFLDDTNFMAWNLEHDRGVPWHDATEAVRVTHPEYARVFAQYPHRFADALVGELADSMAVLDELRARGTRLLALTNFARGNFEVARDRYPWLDDFEGIVVSSHEGVVKPDPQIYRILINRYAVDPGAAVFVDDRPENVEAARVLGFRGVDFLSGQQLRADLSTLGLLPA